MRFPVALVLVLAAAGVAHAAPTVRLVTDGDACSVDATRSGVTAQLGRDPFSGDAPRVLRVEIATADGGGVVADVTVLDDDGALVGPRTLRAPDCAELERSLAIVIAAAVRSLPPVHQEVDDEPAVPQPAPELHDAPPPPAPRAPHANSLAILAGFGIGARTEEVAGVRVRHGRASLLVQARRGGADAVTIAPSASSAAIAPFAFDAIPCAHAGTAFACGIVTAGWQSGSAHGLADLDAARLPLFGLGARIGAEYHLTEHAGIAFRADLRALVTETRFQVDHMTVWESSRFEAAAGIDVFAQIP